LLLWVANIEGEVLDVILGAAAEVEDDLRAFGPVEQRQAESKPVQFVDDAPPALQIGARVHVDLLQAFEVGGPAVREVLRPGGGAETEHQDQELKVSHDPGCYQKAGGDCQPSFS
jgi:hypothetical protein